MARFVDGVFLAQGGFGKVYRYLDEETGRRVAIKFLQKRDMESRRRFEHEIRLLRRHRGHPNIVRFVHAGTSPKGSPYLVVGYCRRGTLRKWVGASVGWWRVSMALMDAADGLAEVHAHGGFHRDVKPDNLLVGWDAEDERELIKLSDFGLAREPVTGAPNITRSAMGTRGYTAPEIVNGYPYLPSADVYSLGVTGIELLSGRRDLGAITRVAMPSYLRKILKAMCNLNPRQRPTAEDIGDGLNWLLTSPRADRRVLVERQPPGQSPLGWPWQTFQ